MGLSARVMWSLLSLAIAAQVQSRALPTEFESILELPHLAADPAKGYLGLYDLSVAGLHWRVDVYYFFKPEQKQFFIKSKGSGVDIPWCGPYTYKLSPLGDGTYNIDVVGTDPQCGKEAEKQHPVRKLQRVWSPSHNAIVQTMEVYTAWPIGWKALRAECNSCADPECIMG